MNSNYTSFGELLQAKNVCVKELAEWCCVSRQMIYRYINGIVQPDRLRYLLVTNIATFLDENPDFIYNTIVESFERVHDYDEEKDEWI